MRRSKISLSDTMRRLNPYLDAGEPANVPQRAKNRARKRHTPEHAEASVAGVRRGGEKLGEYCVSYMRKLEGANAGAHGRAVARTVQPLVRTSDLQ